MQAPSVCHQEVAQGEGGMKSSVTSDRINSKSSVSSGTMSEEVHGDRTRRRKQVQKMRRKLGQMEREANAAPGQPHVGSASPTLSDDPTTAWGVATEHVHGVWGNLRRELLNATGCRDTQFRSWLMEALVVSQADLFTVPHELAKAVSLVEAGVNSHSPSVTSAAREVVRAIDAANCLFSPTQAPKSAADQTPKTEEGDLIPRQTEVAVDLQAELDNPGLRAPKASRGDLGGDDVLNSDVASSVGDQQTLYAHRGYTVKNTFLHVCDELDCDSETESLCSHGGSSRRSSSVPPGRL